MRELVEATVGLVHAVRLATPSQWGLRLLLFVALAGAGVLCRAWFPVLLAGPMLVLVVLGALWCVVRPGSVGPLLTIGLLVVWWLSGGGPDWLQSAVLALCLAVAHLACAFAAAAPSYSAVRPRALRRMLSLGLAYLGACGVGVAVVLGVAAVPDGMVPRGMAWVLLGLVAVVGAGVVAASRLRSGD